MKRENALLNKVRLAMKAHGASCHRYHGSAYGERGHSDLYGTIRRQGTDEGSFYGVPYYLEIKAPGKLSTLKPWQEAFLEEERRHGAMTGVIDSLEALQAFLDRVFPVRLSTGEVVAGREET